MWDAAEAQSGGQLPPELQEQLWAVLAKKLEQGLSKFDDLEEDAATTQKSPSSPPEAETTGIQLFARVTPGSAMLAETNRTLAPEPQLCKPERKKKVKLKVADWEQLAVTSESIVKGAAKAARLALPSGAPDIHHWAEGAQQQCHSIKLSPTLRKEGLTGPPVAVSQLVRLDDAVRSQCLHHSKFQMEWREEERVEAQKRAALRSRKSRKRKPEQPGSLRSKSKGIAKPLTPAQTRAFAEDIFAQLIGKG